MLLTMATLLGEAFLPNRWGGLEKTLSCGKPVVRRKEDLKRHFIDKDKGKDEDKYKEKE